MLSFLSLLGSTAFVLYHIYDLWVVERNKDVAQWPASFNKEYFPAVLMSFSYTLGNADSDMLN